MKNSNYTIKNKVEKIESHTISSWIDYIPSLIYGSGLTTQIILVFFYNNYYNLHILNLIGWGFLALFLVIGSLPRIAFKKYGEIEKNKSHVNTTKLVDKGIYSYIRHPYWLCWILLSLAVTLLSQYYILVILSFPVCALIYGETFLLDKKLIKKFGEEYREYKKKVPRMNLILGIIKLLKKNKKRTKLERKQIE